jgi:hypothetical protein
MPEIVTIDDSDDDDLERAIALSLQTNASELAKDAVHGPQPHDDDGQDEDIKRAIALSLQANSGQPSTSDNQPEKISKPDSNVDPSAPGGIQGLDRRKMEEERLSRVAKKRQASSEFKAPAEEIIEPSSKKLKTFQPESSFIFPAIEKSSLQYPQGVIRKTWSPVHPRGSDIKIEEVLNADKAKLAIICSYMWDLEWLFTKFKERTTKFLFVMDARTEAERQERAREAEIVGRGRIGVCFPPLQGVAKMIHCKFMLLVYDDSLRLVITSANLTPYDWGETGVLENVVFVIDLPRLEAPRAEAELPFFGHELLYFLTKANLPEASLKSLLKFDFAATKNMAFVHSV